MSVIESIKEIFPGRTVKRLYLLAWCVCLISLVSAIILTKQHLAYKHRIYTEHQAQLQKLTIAAVDQIEQILKQAMHSADTLAEEITRGTVNRQNMHAELKSLIVSNAYFYGGSITFAPYRYDPKIKLYSAYYSKSGRDGKIIYTQLDKENTYTNPLPEYEWYGEAMARGNRWCKPYWDKSGRTNMTTYSAIFYAIDPQTKKRIPTGMVTIDISVNYLKNIIESLNLGPSGFGALTTSEGSYLYHKNRDYVQNQSNIRRVDYDGHGKYMRQIADRIARGESGFMELAASGNSRASWLFHQAIPVSGWSLLNTIIIDDLAIDVIRLRQEMILILVCFLVTAISLCFILLSAKTVTHWRVWLISSSIALLLTTGTVFIWQIALAYDYSHRTSNMRIIDKAALQPLVTQYLDAFKENNQLPPVRIETGLHLDAMEFSATNSLRIAGYIWQRYPAGYTKHKTCAIRFGGSRNEKIKPILPAQPETGSTVRCSFEAELRINPDFSRYPLQIDKLVIPILPLELDSDQMLIPDLKAYEYTSPTEKPGLDPQVFLPGWTITNTGFSLLDTDRKTDFSADRNIDLKIPPTLYYTIGVKRIFIDAFISNLTHLIVVSIILFVLTLLSSTVDIGKILGVCVSVFFVVVFSHIAIRKNISTDEIFYLEYIFFVIYFTIILVPINAIRLTLNLKFRFFDYMDGLMGKVIYWPSVAGAFFIITAIKFY
ncbi:MAG: hypothetical protein OEZ39_19370 [Gammaproteobacteria bacterium]|nr:hypothetical protein [Gammaproteobacteria bacterium]MDH5654026.1 hypothetical protein [Gammaproteobacteria bacterium]